MDLVPLSAAIQENELEENVGSVEGPCMVEVTIVCLPVFQDDPDGTANGRNKQERQHESYKHEMRFIGKNRQQYDVQTEENCLDPD